MDNTYLYEIPGEILDIILYNLEMVDIVSVLGPNFPVRHKQFFRKIVKRDYHSDIITELIKEENVIDTLKYERHI